MKVLPALARALVGTSLALSLISTPAAAGAVAPSTWYVAGTGSGGGSCATPDFNSIGAAIAHAGHGDIILVCPGDYSERLMISGAGKNGLTIRATKPLKATLWAPTSGTKYDPPLVTINNADRVRIQNLRFFARGDLPCGPIGSMIAIYGSSRRTEISGNLIRVAGANTYFEDPCGFGSGIVDATDGGGSTLIAANTVRDFRYAGISSSSLSPRIVRNVIRFWHRGVSGAASDGAGIDLGGTVHAIVKGNVISGLSSAAFSSDTPVLAKGISAAFDADLAIKDNSVRYADEGIVVGDETGAYVLRNTVLRSLGKGIWLSAVANSFVRHNVSLRSTNLDCEDDASPSSNTWADDTGNTSSPAGLCTPPAP